MYNHFYFTTNSAIIPLLFKKHNGILVLEGSKKHENDQNDRPAAGRRYGTDSLRQHRCCQQLLPSVFHRVSPFKSAVPNITGVKGLFLHSSGEHRQDNTNFLQLYGEISYRFLTVPETTERSASFGSRTFYVSSITPRGRWRRWGRCRCKNRSPGKRQHR